MKHSQKNKGFSLVELIVIVAILSVLVAVVSLSNGIVGRSKVKAAAQTIQVMLERCREENINGLNCKVVVKTGKYVSLETSNGSVIEREDFPSAVTVATSSKGSGKNFSVTFAPSTGKPTSSYSKYTFYIYSGSTQYTLTVNQYSGLAVLN